MEQTGGCLCGAVRYRVTGAPQSTSLCHCFSCRRSTGGPSLAWAIFDEDKVEIVSGTLAVFESSPGVERGFCARCGTSLTYRRANRPGLFDVTTASLDDPEAFPPTKDQAGADVPRTSAALSGGQGDLPDLGRGAALLGSGQSGAAAIRAVQHVGESAN